jgi:hypothetical protein
MELDAEAKGIGKLQRAALKRLLCKIVDDAVFRKERCRLVEIPLVADLEAEAIASGARALRSTSE